MREIVVMEEVKMLMGILIWELQVGYQPRNPGKDKQKPRSRHRRDGYKRRLRDCGRRGNLCYDLHFE